MLQELHIENVAVIERADVSFGSGLNVLTGETGAGKSIVIDSIGAVLGRRTSRGLIRTGEEKALVSAVFTADGALDWCAENDIEPEDGTLVVMRRISSSGKSGCRVNGVPVSISQLRELGERLLDIHGQNDGLQLMDERRHLEYLDSFGVEKSKIEAFRSSYERYRAAMREMKRLSMDESEKDRMCDSLRYQIEELEKASLRPGEESELAERHELLKNAERLTSASELAYSAVYGADESAIELVGQAEAAMGRVSGYSAELQEAAKTLKEARFLLEDASERIRDFLDGLDFSPEEYDKLEGRLALLKKLSVKYGADEEEMLAHLDACRSKLDDIEYAGDKLARLEKEAASLREKAVLAASELTKARRETAKKLQKQIEGELHELSMPSAKFFVEVRPVESSDGFTSAGADTVSFSMSANAGEKAGPISRIASGGELSRIMLAMKNVFAENDGVDAMVFDEIDTGVSGVAAQRVGEKLAELSRHRQVLCITHLPQIAAMADRQYEIRKTEHDGRTFTSVSELDSDGRRKEIARLYGGDNITENTLVSAGDQLEAADKYKKRLMEASDD